MSANRSLSKVRVNTTLFPFFVLVFFSVISLSSCLSMQGPLPKPKSGIDTLLVIKLDRSGISDIHSDYVLYTKEGGMIKIDTNRRYVFRRGMSAGRHSIVSIEAFHKEYEGFSRLFDTPEISFAIIPGNITILPWVLQIVMDENNQIHRFAELHPAELSAIREELVEYGNHDLWNGFYP